MPYLDGALPSVDSRPNAISLTCPSANTRICSDTRGLGADRSELDTGLRSPYGNGVTHYCLGGVLENQIVLI